MGLGGYLAARTEREKEEVAEVLRGWGLQGQNVEQAVKEISADPNLWVAFMMKLEFELESPSPRELGTVPPTIGLSYNVGGIIPIIPYMLINRAATSLIVSVVATLMALFIFGYVKGKFTGSKPLKSAIQTALVGGVAAGIAFLVAKIIS